MIPKNLHQGEANMKQHRYSFLIVLSAVCLAFFCSGLVSAKEFNWRQFEGTKIRVLRGKTEYTSLMIKETKEFEELTGITVQAEYYPAAALRRKLTMELGAKNPDLDVFGGQMKTAYQFHAAGWLEPLDGYLKNPALIHPDFDFADILPRTNPYIDGKLIAMSNSANPQFLIYRKDLFQQYGIKVPTSWDELEAAARTLKENLPKGQLVWIARMNDESPAPFSSFLFANGGEWLDSSGNPVFNSPQATDAMDFYARMARQYGPPGASTISWKEAIGAIAQGKAAMTFEVSIFVTLVLENPKKSKVVGKLGYVRLPPGPSNQEYQDVLPLNITHISAFSNKKEAAWLFVQYIAMKNNVLRYKMAGLPVTRLSAWEHPEWKAKDQFPELSELQLNAMKNGRIGFEIPIAQFSEARPVIARALYSIYDGESAQAAADKAVLEVKRIMEH